MKKNISRPQSQGFTLIELSIVLVIIGLIISGVLVGQELVKGAEVRKTIAELEKFSTAVNTFRGKYNCLAGDCTKATEFFTGSTQPSQVNNGDGDGVIEGNSNSDMSGIYIGIERAYIMDHLASAKLINLQPFDEAAGDMSAITAGNGYLKTPIGTGFFVHHAYIATATDPTTWIIAGGHAFLVGAVPNTGDSYFDSVDAGGNGLVTAPDAYAIDSKIDDGVPLIGRVKALAPVTGDTNTMAGLLATAAAPGSGSCVSNASGNPYSNDVKDKCSVSVKASF